MLAVFSVHLIVWPTIELFALACWPNSIRVIRADQARRRPEMR
jgi:hypothetical protein